MFELTTIAVFASAKKEKHQNQPVYAENVANR
jgi:hypothetical protein